MHESNYSVRLGNTPDYGLEGQKSFPFIYTFINYNDIAWNASPTPGLVTNEDLSTIGKKVLANGLTTVNVKLDPDYDFKLISIKYSAYQFIPGRNLPPPAPQYGTYAWYDNTAGINPSDGNDCTMGDLGSSILRNIGITLSFQGSGSKVQYGGDSTTPLYIGRVPLHVEAIQGYDYGFLTTRTPYLLPRQGVLAFDITNSASYDIIVAAAIYGMKVRV